MTKRKSLLAIVLAYIVALVVAFLSTRYTEERFGWFYAGLLADGIATLVIYAFSTIYRNASTYDPYWSVIPFFLYFYWAARAGTLGQTRSLIVLGVALVWSIRLTSNWVRDWRGLSHEDWRYAELRKKSGRAFPLVSFFAIHFFPTAIVALASLPLWASVRSGGNSLGFWDLLGFVVSVGASVLCYAADEQLRLFRRRPEKGVLATGLWSISRHPNYLGEIIFWFGLWFFSMGTGVKWWWTGAGAVAMLLMFCFISIPWMERKILRTRPQYRDLVRSVPMLIPLPGTSAEKK